jgi:uncharacterized protein YhaN
LTGTLMLSLLLSVQIAGATDAPTLTADAYWQLTKARLELTAHEWQERITSAEQAKGDRQMLIARSAAITKQYRGYERQLHEQAGISQQDFLQFASSHSREIESYLEENQDVKRDLEALRLTIRSLMDQFDSLTQAKPNGEIPR